jgi:hypothetical protein
MAAQVGGVQWAAAWVDKGCLYRILIQKSSTIRPAFINYNTRKGRRNIENMVTSLSCPAAAKVTRLGGDSMGRLAGVTQPKHHQRFLHLPQTSLERATHTLHKRIRMSFYLYVDAYFPMPTFCRASTVQMPNVQRSPRFHSALIALDITSQRIHFPSPLQNCFLFPSPQTLSWSSHMAAQQLEKPHQSTLSWHLSLQLPLRRVLLAGRNSRKLSSRLLL